MARFYRFRRRPQRRSSETTRALEAARREARLTFTELGRALGLHPRTVRRWELGESKPREGQWAKVLALYAQRAPNAAPALALSTGRALPVPERAREVDAHAASRVVMLAADAIDVAPKRVREVLIATAQAAASAGIPFDAFARAVMKHLERAPT